MDLREYGTVKEVQAIECIGYRLDRSRKKSREVNRGLVTEGLGAKLWNEAYIRKQ